MSEAKLRDALEAVREDLAPPRAPAPGRSRPTRAQMEKRCNEFTDALAKELGKSGDDVRAAIKAAAKKEIEEAVDAERLTRSQADRILSRIDDAACLPAFGFHVPAATAVAARAAPMGPVSAVASSARHLRPATPGRRAARRGARATGGSRLSRQ